METMCEDTLCNILKFTDSNTACNLAKTNSVFRFPVKNNLYQMQIIYVASAKHFMEPNTVVRSECKVFVTKQNALSFLEKVKQIPVEMYDDIRIGEIRITNDFQNYFFVHSFL